MSTRLFPQMLPARIEKLRRFSHTKLGVSILTLTGSLLLLCSFWLPYWKLNLRAPQYPEGLSLSIYMDHVEGDVSEVNLLNHYIGMAHLDEAAQFERRYAWFGLLVLALVAMLMLPVGKKAYRIFYLPPVVFLGVFVGDLFYWLYRAGHQLNQDAPVHIKPFTPVILGTGKIGQFVTSASFSFGFWMALAGALVLTYAIGRKKPICGGCVRRDTCSLVCTHPKSWFGGSEE